MNVLRRKGKCCLPWECIKFEFRMNVATECNHPDPLYVFGYLESCYNLQKPVAIICVHFTTVYLSLKIPTFKDLLINSFYFFHEVKLFIKIRAPYAVGRVQ